MTEKSPFKNIVPEPMLWLSKHPAFVIPNVPADVEVKVPVSCQQSFVTFVVTREAVPEMRAFEVVEVVPSCATSVKSDVSPCAAVPVPEPEPM